jgi:3-deoxy-D-manno-octulosonic acid (KDO) 8-phosphate synthase
VPVRPVRIAEGVILGAPPLVLIAGPCVINPQHAVDLGGAVATIAKRVGLPAVFKPPSIKPTGRR